MAFLVRVLTSPRVTGSLRALRSFLRNPSFLAGALGGAWIIPAWHQFVARFGGSSASIASALLSIVLAIECGRWIGGCKTARRAPALSALLLAAWTACFPMILGGVAAVASWQSLEQLASAGGSIVFHALAGVIVLAVPGFAFGWLSARIISGPDPEPAQEGASMPSEPRLVFGIAAGALSTMLFVVPWIGAHLAASLGTAFLAAWQLVRWFERRSDTVVRSSRTTPSSVSPSPITSAPGVTIFAAMVCLGMAMAACCRVLDQLMFAAEYLTHVAWISVGLAALAGQRWCAFREAESSGRAGSRASAAMLVASCWTILIIAAFQWLIDLALTMTVVFTWMPALMLSRMLLTAVLLAPSSLALGACLAEANRDPATRAGRGGWLSFPLGWIAPALGVVLAQLLLMPGRGPVVAALGSATVLGVLALVREGRPWASAPGWLIRLAGACAMAFLAASPWLIGGYRPAESAALLFKGSVYAARHAGLERKFLAVMDESRPAAAAEGNRSTFTVWLNRGAQISIRENGMPRGSASVRPVICPQNSNELMLATLPLMLHEAPHRVLLLGAGSGLGVLAAQAFPTQSTSCVEPEGALVELLARHAWPHGDQNPLAESRLTFRTLEPALALCAGNEAWDVIVSNPRASATASAASEFTREFYAAAARRLSEHGLFCQRFAHGDYGPGPILSVVKSMQTAFRTVAVIGPGPGELLVFATNSDRGVVREGFTNRLQADHARRMLSQAGWDWTVPLTLTAYDSNALSDLAATAPLNTVANGRFAFRLPQELMRWAPKWQETSAAFASKATRVVAWPTIDGSDAETLERLSEIAGQKNLMTSFVDQPWAYRKTLRDQLKKSKKSIIRQAVAATEEEQVHPVDQHRKEYFAALGVCARQADPKLDDIAQLEEFTTPYDPLVSYFVHHELAEFQARRKTPDRTAELEHRLHLAWYADPRDRSVRQITRALDLLVAGDLPGVDPLTRWDQMNGLLQLLLSRWENRSTAKPGPTQVTLKDIELSIAVSEKAMDVLAGLADEAGVTHDEWSARRSILERALVRPLRTLRGQLLPRSLVEDRTNREANLGGTVEPPSAIE